MKFRIISTADIDKELIDKYPCLKEYGYEEEEKQKVYEVKHKIRDENGCLITQITEHIKVAHIPYIHIYDLSDLLKLEEEVERPLIIMQDDDGTREIEIYDGYRE